MEILKTKRKGTYNIIKIDPSYIPEIQETKDVFGITFEQDRNEAKITSELLVNRPTVNKEIPEDAVRDLLIALITLKYTQSNSDDYEDILADGIWEQFFTEKPAPLTREEKKVWLHKLHGVSLGSDAFFPFGDNIERAHRSGVDYIAQAGGSIRDDNVIETCDKYNIAMAFTGLRLFHH